MYRILAEAHEVRDRREKVLYYEGEPRWEPKFVLSAVEDDKNIQVVLLQRTAENKYFRRNVSTPDEVVRLWLCHASPPFLAKGSMALGAVSWIGARPPFAELLGELGNGDDVGPGRLGDVVPNPLTKEICAAGAHLRISRRRAIRPTEYRLRAISLTAVLHRQSALRVLALPCGRPCLVFHGSAWSGQSSRANG